MASRRGRCLLLTFFCLTAEALQLHRPRRQLEEVEEEPWTPVEETFVNGTLQCDDSKMDRVLWGVYIDGRDAAGKGKRAYGHNYGPPLEAALHEVHALLATANATALQPSDFLAIVTGRRGNGALPWRNNNSPMRKEVQTCQHEAFPQNHIEEIFEGLMAINQDYSDIAKGKDHKSFELLLQDMFAQYNAKMGAANNTDQKLHALSFLMRNLAYMHPFGDKNGRNRMLLAQYELRRNNIACGAMLYNNNKDIYFQTESEFAGKLQEGIDMYRKAAFTGENPWQNKSAKMEHHQRFPNPYKEKLEHCWKKFCPKHWNELIDRQGAKNCEGTSIALSRSDDETYDF